ncbi:universal stress protein [Streptomyces virginiae]
MRHNVTVGVGGSPESRAAARWGAREASLWNVPLCLVHAVDGPMSPAMPRMGHESAAEWADDILAEAAAELRGRHPRMEITTRCVSGRPAAALAAEALDAGLLVLGSRGVGRLFGFLIGSVGLATVIATDAPVVLVRTADDLDGPAPDEYGEIVVGVDIHEEADRMLSFAFEEASRRHCPLRAVHCWKFPAPYEYVPFFDPDNEREIGASVAEMLDNMLLPWRHKFPWVSVTTQAFRGAAGRELIRVAADADLVVVGRHARRSPLGAHLGSVAHAVLHHCAAPVAVIAHD